uniref:Uncharacterized protein n=1 Tax=Opuntia streptacantha TaxID=393608 RepID=A0A7C9E854_OPUST
MSRRNFLLCKSNVSRSFRWKAITALRYISFANFDSACRVKSTKSYLKVTLPARSFPASRNRCKALMTSWVGYHKCACGRDDFDSIKICLALPESDMTNEPAGPPFAGSQSGN